MSNVRGEFGAKLLVPGRTEFRLWAPDCDRVSVEVDGVGGLPMVRGGSGIFEAVVSCGAGARYRYRISSDLTVPDPASRAQDGDVHDSSIVIDQNQYKWRTRQWHGRPWHEAVIYELHAGTYGGFAQIAADLPRLARLGFTAVELMPIADFPGRRNWGYDGVLPYAPDTAYGTPDELKSLIDTAHELRLMVFLDVVYNHFGPDGNYLNVYAPAFFRHDVETPWGGAIDYRHWQVRRFFIENALYWLNDYWFDGLRFDAVHAIGDSEFLIELAREIRTGVAPGRQVHLVLENERNQAELLNPRHNQHRFDAQWNDDWHHCLHVLLTGESEGYYSDFQNPAAQLARCLKEGFAYQGEASAHQNGKRRGTPSGDLPTTAFVIALQNHDQIGNRALGERLASLARPDTLRAATLLLLLTPQIPLIFMGEEWGETRTFLFFTDHHDELADAVRQGRRKEFAHFTAFADESQRERIPDPNAVATFQASVPNRPVAPNPQQAWYEQALRLRSEHITPRLPGTVALHAVPLGNTAVRACWRMGDGAVLTLAANFGPDAQPCAAAEGDLLLSTAPDAISKDLIPAYSAAVWLRLP